MLDKLNINKKLKSNGRLNKQLIVSRLIENDSIMVTNRPGLAEWLYFSSNIPIEKIEETKTQNREVTSVLNVTDATGALRVRKLINQGQYSFMIAHTFPGFFISISRDKYEPKVLDSIVIDNGPNSFKLDGNFAYAVTNTGILYKIDISDPKNMSSTSINITGSMLWDLYVDTNYIYVTSSVTNSLRVIDKNTFTSIASVNIGSIQTGVQRVGDHLYVSAYSTKRLYIFDLTLDPTLQSGSTFVSTDTFFNGSPNPNRLGEAFGYLFLNNINGDQVVILNVSNPTNPSLQQLEILDSQKSSYSGFNSNSKEIYLGSIEHIRILDENLNTTLNIAISSIPGMPSFDFAEELDGNDQVLYLPLDLNGDQILYVVVNRNYIYEFNKKIGPFKFGDNSLMFENTVLNF